MRCAWSARCDQEAQRGSQFCYYHHKAALGLVEGRELEEPCREAKALIEELRKEQER